MRKGMTVKLNIDKCFTSASGGKRQFPVGTWGDDERGVYITYRPLTEVEVREWYDSPSSKGINCAGETKLPPTCKAVEIYAHERLEVRRARCRVSLGYGNPTPGMMEVKTALGEVTYIKRGIVIPA
jgi:hypothetical protein